MPGTTSWFDNHPRWSDTLMEALGIVLGLVFVGGTLWAASNMSPKERDDFLLEMQNFSLEQYD